MPFTDPVSSISGRNSRASNVSAATGASRSLRSPPPMGAGADALANAGVLSMLKTSTDTGDIGALSFNSTRLPSMPYRSGQRRQQPSKTSASSHPYPGGSNSHHYAASVTSRVSSATRDWETGSNGRRGSMTSMQTMPTFVSDTQPSVMSHPGRPMGLGPIPSSGNRRDSRSYSLTNAVASSQLPRHKSATSLKSQGHEPRRYDGQPPPMPEIRPPPYVYPTRLKRPGYRSPSPAQSESYAQAQPPPIPLQNAHRRQQDPPVPPMPRPAMPTYHSDYGQGFPVDPTHLNVPPPPRAMPNTPMMPYEQMPSSQPPFNYRPGPMKPSPAVVMQHPGQRMPPPPPHHPQQHPYGPPRPMYAANGYAMQPQQRRGPPPSPNVGPVAHHIFHNAARLARQLPQRTDTPMTEAGAPSSDPPSSGTAPTTSSPPTPKDQTTIQVAVDPAFIDPALTDLPESTSDPVIPAKYFDYIDGLEKAAEDSEIEAHHASVPPSGFVQRVKAMLESRAAADAAAKREAEREHERGQGERHIEHAGIYELAAPEIERVTVIEEFDAPVELPASPVIVAEMPASPVKSMRRLTRDMVKAELAPSTTEIEQSSKYATVETPSPLKPHETVLNDEEQEPFEPSTVNDDIAEDTPLPSSPPELQHKRSVTDSVPSCDGSRKVDGMDFAVHFSPPSETEATATDLGETETESRDPFALDADTITAQHKGGKETPSHPELDESPHAPVSPLLPGEQVDRFSAVSPIHEETAGIDETMMALRDDSSPLDHRLRRPYRHAANDENLAPPTPRTPRSYSKSVQLPHPTDTPTNSNRLSLPADLGQIGDTTINSTDAMTDVAVRFSLPQNTVTLAKPQIVQIASSTPPKDEPAPLKSAIHAPERQRRHGSVTFEDEVAPLKVNKKTDQHRQSQSLGAIALRTRPQASRGPSPFEAQSDSDRGSQDTTTDLRFSGINFIRNKYPSTHLPGLKEESSEDMSVTTHRQSTDIANGLQFQLPARIAAVKAMQERRQQELQDKEKMREARNRPHPDAGRPLGETRDLPSLNFSRMDLIDKLNEALQVRTRKSLEVVRRRDFSAIYHPSPQRPQSTDPTLWDRYTSFFNKPEDFPEELEDEEQPNADEAEDAGNDSKPSSRRHSKTASEGDADSAKRPLSPEERMLNVATQVNRLSIPSVNGLSERLSELLPNLRDLNLDTVLANDQQIAHTIDDIHQLGKIPGARPDTVLSTRTSAGFRTLAERAEEIVKNGTHDSVIPLRALGLNKELPPLPGSASLDKVSAQSPVDGRSSYLSGSISAPSELTNQLQRPASALIRGKSHLTEDEVQRLLPPEMNPIARGSKRSLVVSSLSSRPWNLDENYPWARSNLHIDLVAPDQVHHRETLAAELARHRGTKSLDCTLTGDLLGNTSSGIDIGSITTDLDPRASVTTLQLTGVSTHHARKHSKRSMFGSIKHKIGLSRSHHDDTTRSLPTSPGLRTADEPTHNPGDRYPTTALTPPVAFNLDEVRSYFSDDSSESNKERKTPKGRRWTGLKSKSSKANTHNNNNPDPARGAQSLDETGAANPHPYDTASLAADRTALDSSAAFTLDGIGMGKAEFRIKRLGEKLRVWFARGGELFRSLSVRSARGRKAAAARERERDEWLSDSLYSGV